MTMTAAPARELRQRLVTELEEARARTLLLVAPLSDEDLHAQHDPLMSPILWDLGHIAHFEELWLTRNLDGPIEFVEMPGMYNPFEHPRSTRGALPLPGLERVREVMNEIRSRVLARLQSADFDADHPLLACEQVVLTPHNADQTPEGMDLLNAGVVDNVIAFLEGRPQNVVT